MHKRNRIEIPGGHALRCKAKDAFEGGHGRVGQPAAFRGRVSDRVGDRHVVVPLPSRVAAPGDAGVDAESSIDLKPEADLVIRGHLFLQQLHEETFNQSVVLQQPGCRKLMRLD